MAQRHREQRLEVLRKLLQTHMSIKLEEELKILTGLLPTSWKTALHYGTLHCTLYSVTLRYLLPQVVKARPRAHTASYSVGTGVLSQR